MEDIPENLVHTLIGIGLKFANDEIQKLNSEIEEQKRRNGLRKGSIDVEFRVIK